MRTDPILIVLTFAAWGFLLLIFIVGPKLHKKLKGK